MKTQVKLKSYKNLDEPSEKELLQYVMATQLIILRRLDFVKEQIDKLLSPGLKKEPEDTQTHEKTVKDMLLKIPTSIERIDEGMKQ